jgi:ABC-type Fe3+ transport system permease subunit
VSSEFGPLASAVSVVLGVLTYFLTMVYGAATKVLEEDIPPTAQKAARRALRRRLRRVLVVGALPLWCAFIVLFYICFPTAVGVIRTSTFQLWTFDLRKTLFVYLELGVATCCGLCAFVGVRLVAKLWRSGDDV